jgi:hypothetical protein
MNHEVRLFLIELARKRHGFIFYQDLSDKCNLGFNFRESPYDRKEIGRILGEISAFEHSNDRPLLSALVLSKSLEEGDGFYRLCEELGYGSYRKLKGDPTFAPIQMNRCYEFWQNDSNYAKYRDL